MNTRIMEEMRDLSNKTITSQAEINSRQYDRMFKKVAKAAFEEGARWFASEMAKGMKAIEEGC